jgi:ferredoxin
MLAEWTGDELVYLSAVGAVKKFGYPSPGMLPDATPAGRDYYGRIAAGVERQDGPVADRRADFGSPVEAAAAVKQWAVEHGATMAGITLVDRRYVYRGEDLPHRYAIVLAMAMDYDQILQLPRPEGNEEFVRVYERLAELSVGLAAWLRAAGSTGRAHTLCREQLAMLPHAYAAGLGELGKHGSLINRRLGCSFRVSVVTTDMPLALDAPADEGIDHFCTSCDMCVRYCPGDAIKHEKQVVRGTSRWIVDTALCAPFFSTYHACGICLQVCPWNVRAFKQGFRARYLDTVKSLDPAVLRRDLTAELIEPWTLVSKEETAT